jgi:alanine dehydrogenase
MRVGVPKEIKNHEYRVGLTPAGVRELKAHGHEVLVEKRAGEGIGIRDEQYEMAGARLVAAARDVFAKSELIVKVKEPQPAECKMLSEGQVLFTYLHLAPDPAQAKALVKSGSVAIAYETVTDGRGGLPLLAPMSEVAGRMSIQAGAHALEKAQGGLGVLMGGVPGVAPANVAILGGGIVGANAARVAVGLGAQVSVLDINHDRLKYLDDIYRGSLQTRNSDDYNIEDVVFQADLVIGAVLIPGGRAPWLITRDMLKHMRRGSVIVDVAVDQGGCVETTRPTTHSNPTYEIDGVVHYCVANMPGAVPRTSTFALNNQTMNYTLRLAGEGLDAVRRNRPLQLGLNTHKSLLTYPGVAEAFDLPYTDPIVALN